MTNEQVTIYLNTPLVAPQPKGTLVERASMIRGKVLSELQGGIFVQIKAIGNEKGWSEHCPFKKIFVPHHKIDFVSVD